MDQSGTPFSWKNTTAQPTDRHFDPVGTFECCDHAVTTQLLEENRYIDQLQIIMGCPETAGAPVSGLATGDRAGSVSETGGTGDVQSRVFQEGGSFLVMEVLGDSGLTEFPKNADK